jgi:hypothetical protein
MKSKTNRGPQVVLSAAPELVKALFRSPEITTDDRDRARTGVVPRLPSLRITTWIRSALRRHEGARVRVVETCGEGPTSSVDRIRWNTAATLNRRTFGYYGRQATRTIFRGAARPIVVGHW